MLKNNSKFRGKLSKRQIAGALLLSSTAIGAASSSAASANAVTDFFKNAGNKVSDGLGVAWEGTKSGLNTAWRGTKGAFNKAGSAIYSGLSKGGDYAVWGLDKAGDVLKAGVTKAGDVVSKGYNFVNGKANGKISEYAGKVAYKAKEGLGKFADRVKSTSIGQKAGNLAGKVGDKFSELGSKIAKTGVYKKYLKPAGTAVGEFATEHAWGLAAVTLVSALMYGTYKVYKYISTANLRKFKAEIASKKTEIADFILKNNRSTIYGNDAKKANDSLYEINDLLDVLAADNYSKGNISNALEAITEFEKYVTSTEAAKAHNDKNSENKKNAEDQSVEFVNIETLKENWVRLKEKLFKLLINYEKLHGKPDEQNNEETNDEQNNEKTNDSKVTA